MLLIQKGHCVFQDLSAVDSTSDLARCPTESGYHHRPNYGFMSLSSQTHTHTLLPPVAVCRKNPLKVTSLPGTRLISKYSRKDTLKQFCPRLGFQGQKNRSVELGKMIFTRSSWPGRWVYRVVHLNRQQRAKMLHSDEVLDSSGVCLLRQVQKYSTMGLL